MVWTTGLKTLRTKVHTAIDAHVPLIVLTGDVGAGKTTFLSALLRDCIPQGTHVVFARGSISDTDDLLEFVAENLPNSLETNGHPVERITAAAQKMSFLVLLDEAQSAAPEAVLELYQLASGEGRLTLLLAGQPELRTRLSGTEYRGLSVPPDHRHIIALPSEEEAQTYIASRLEAAGGSADLIQDDAKAVIISAAQRVPRMINKVADACLFLAAMEDREGVDAEFARRVIKNDLDPISLALSPGDFHAPLADAYSIAGHDAAAVTAGADTEVSPFEDPGSHQSADGNEPAREVNTTAERLSNDGRSARARRIPRPLLWTAGAATVVPVVIGLLVLLPNADVATDTLLERSKTVSMPIDHQEVQGDLESAGGSVATPVSERIVIDADPELATSKSDSLSEAPMPEMRNEGSDPAASSSVPAPEFPALEVATVTEAEASRLYARALSEDDPLQSAIYYARAGVLGHDRAATYIGQKYETGDGVSFSPEMAARWYAVAEGKDPEETSLADGPMHAARLWGAKSEGRIDLVWDGIASAFDIELGNADRTVIGRVRLVLPAVSLVAVADATYWRVRATGEEFSEWTPIAPVEE